MLRVRFAPSPTGFLHVGSARTFILNWLYARHNQGTMILRVDDTDVERNTEASLTSIFEGLRWLDLPWDEQYRQSERLALHKQMAEAIFAKGMAYRDFTPAHEGDSPRPVTQGAWLFNPGAREISRDESDRRAAAGEPFALRFRVPREPERTIRFDDAVYGEQAKSTADIEDFALLRSDGMPTYHMASCADDADLRISHIIRGQDHLTNTFKHVLIFEAAGAAPPQFAHLPLLIAPDGTKLSKRKHGPVVSVTTYRDAGFLPEAFVNFLCLLGWSPKNDRELLTRQELIELFSLEGINRANAVVNFKDVVAPPTSPEVAPPLSRPGEPVLKRSEGAGQGGGFLSSEEMFDPKALWLNAEHIRALPVDELCKRMLPVVREAGFDVSPEQMQRITPLVRERIKLLKDVLTVADFFFVEQLPSYDPAELIPQKGDAAMALKALKKAREVLASTEFKHDAMDAALRAAAQELKVKAGQMFQPIRVAVCGRKNAPPLFETLEVLGKEKTLARIEQGIGKLEPSNEEIRKRDELAAAEDFRRQLQERTLREHGLWPRTDVLDWVDQNTEMLVNIASVTGFDKTDETPIVSQLREELARIQLASPHDHPFTHAIVLGICEEIETACRELGIPLRSGVAYGSTPSLEVTADQCSVHFTDASVISLSAGFISFCSHITKMFSMSLLHEPQGETLKVIFDPGRVLAHIGSNPDLKYYWTEIIGGYAYGSGPLVVKHRLVPYPASITRVQLLMAIERFAVAHEFAHHVAQHGLTSVLTAGVSPKAKGEEFEADLFALGLSRYLGSRETPQNVYSMSGCSAVLLLKCSELVRRTRQIFVTGNDTIEPSKTHPTVAERISAFDELDQYLPDLEKRHFRILRDDFAVIIDAVWEKLKPWFVDMHNHGLRPESSNNESWLPR